MEVTFTATPVSGGLYIGEVIDLATQRTVARTGTRYTSAETAKSAAASMWRSLQAQMAEVSA